VSEADAWRRPAPQLLALRRAEVAGLTVLVLLGAGVPVTVSSVADGAVVAGGVLGAGGLLMWFVQRRVGAWGYCEREDDLLVRRGVLITRLSVVPYGRMQFIDVTAGPLERAFRLSTVKMHTAAAASDARIPGLSRAEAARLRDQLAALGEARAAGL